MPKAKTDKTATPKKPGKYQSFRKMLAIVHIPAQQSPISVHWSPLAHRLLLTYAAGKRGASPYNLFMKTELAKVKQENPNIAHKEAFKLAASNWKNSPANPNRVK
ncbi:uncharacterized protein EV422DRAFT_528567 [Fimicolochytrium jonesii]|uniref:uncharacterized protein n=1 Tax=Fimicolochytrium jonesii TaxID=1396493 RepID=UPI0022FDE576|nr:uncharacterized protein EV422DRAFT_528567 [Fimicolochytrium jonesii]KAI8820963.1 hypothetical protein EV422DRAFT_528567 [Fimicolochytrium jonesii]